MGKNIDFDYRFKIIVENSARKLKFIFVVQLFKYKTVVLVKIYKAFIQSLIEYNKTICYSFRHLK